MFLSSIFSYMLKTQMLGFINTQENKQIKGIKGSIK